MAHQPNKNVDPLARHSLSPSELKELLQAERVGGPFLALRDGDGQLELFAPGGGGSAHTIGRGAETTLSIAWDPEVSGLHAELQGLGGEWAIVDDGLSTNGTFVNGQRVAGRRRLRDGDCIRVGQTVLAYRAGGPAPVEETAAAGQTPAPPELTETQRRVLIALCRPYRDGDSFANPPTNRQIADEVFLSVDAVKMHLRTLFAKFELSDLAQNEKRARLAECALRFGVISQHDLT
jgi:FHA domain